MQVFHVLFYLFTFLHRLIGETWNYQDIGPDMWSETYPSCTGQSQSPIDIRTACTVYQTFPTFNVSSAYSFSNNFTLLNIGHTVATTYNGNDTSIFTLTGGGLNGTFEFVNFHLHWDYNYKSGSEHRINGAKYAGEIHFVHRNRITNDIAVLGIFIQTMSQKTIKISKSLLKLDQNAENATRVEWRKYFDAAASLHEINNSTALRLNLTSLMGNNLRDFWRYRGSLTTPPCTEGVMWTIFKTPITLSDDEIQSFRQNIIPENYRSPQPLYYRTVYRNFLNERPSSIPDYLCCLYNSHSPPIPTAKPFTIAYLFVFVNICMNLFFA